MLVGRIHKETLSEGAHGGWDSANSVTGVGRCEHSALVDSAADNHSEGGVSTFLEDASIMEAIRAFLESVPHTVPTVEQLKVLRRHLAAFPSHVECFVVGEFREESGSPLIAAALCVHQESSLGLRLVMPLFCIASNKPLLTILSDAAAISESAAVPCACITLGNLVAVVPDVVFKHILTDLWGARSPLQREPSTGGYSTDGSAPEEGPLSSAPSVSSFAPDSSASEQTPSDWPFDISMKMFVDFVITEHKALQAAQDTTINLLARIPPFQLVPSDFATLNVLVSNPDFFVTVPKRPNSVLTRHRKDVVGSTLQDVLPRTVSMSGILPWDAKCRKGGRPTGVAVDALERLGIHSSDQPSYGQEEEVKPEWMQFTSRNGEVCELTTPRDISSLRAAISMALASAATNEAFQLIVEKLLSRRRAIEQVEVRKAVESTTAKGVFSSVVTLVEFSTKEEALSFMLAVSCLRRLYCVPARSALACSMILLKCTRPPTLTQCPLTDNVREAVQVCPAVLELTTIGALPGLAERIQKEDVDRISMAIRGVSISLERGMNCFPEVRVGSLVAVVRAAAAALLYRLATAIAGVANDTTAPDFEVFLLEGAAQLAVLIGHAVAAITAVAAGEERINAGGGLATAIVGTMHNMQVFADPKLMRGRKAKGQVTFIRKQVMGIVGEFRWERGTTGAELDSAPLLRSLHALREAFVGTEIEMFRNDVSAGHRHLLVELLKPLPTATFKNPRPTLATDVLPLLSMPES